MRWLMIAGSVIVLISAGTAAVGWINRVPLAEWAIRTYQPETPLGPISVRISDITLSSISIAEIRAQFRGPVSLQDVAAEFALDTDGHVTVSALHIGSVNAVMSFADWFDLLGSFETADAAADDQGLPELPVTIGGISVETIDLYGETPKGYALLNGYLTVNGMVDFSKQDALARLSEGVNGDLFLSAGAAGFPVDAFITEPASNGSSTGGAKGGGSVVLAINLAGRTVSVQAITPIRVEMEISEPLPGLPSLPMGTYRADFGSDDLPFGMTLGYAVDPAPGLRRLAFDAFPFSLDTPFGTADAQAHTAPIAVTDAPTDAAALPVQLSGRLDLSAVPLPQGILADIVGGFSVDKADRTVIALEKGFKLAADLTASPIRASLPPDLLKRMAGTIALSARSDVTVEFTSGSDGMAVAGTGSVAMKSGRLSATLPTGFSVDAGQSGEIDIRAKTLTAAIAPGPLPLAGDLAVTDLSATLFPGGTARGRARYRVTMDEAMSEGNLTYKSEGDVTELTVTDGAISLSAADMSIPSFRATGRMEGDAVDLSTTLEEVRLGDLRALKRPLSLQGQIRTDDRGGAFKASGSIDTAISIAAEGHFVDGDVVMNFRSGDIPLGPGGAELGALTDLIDLGRSEPSGSIRVEGELTYQNGAVSGYADLRIAEIGSVLADGTSISVLGTVTFDLSRPPATLTPATLTGSLTSDLLGTIPFTETFTLRETGEMEVQSLEARFLGGTITISEGLADAAAGSLVGRMRAEGLDLEALADLLQIEGLAGTGRLTGELKFQVTEDAVIVEAGELGAEEPGLLRYKGEALSAAAEGNENLALLVQALENFHYDVLTLGIDIPEFGDGIVTLHLEGNNPEVLDGYPFDVTINLESEYGRLIKIFLDLYQKMDVILKGAVR